MNRRADGMESGDAIIHVMPEALANKIAAGEVVQRPASALKELMENGLDAGAQSVEVHLKRAGSDLIQVVDDGCGMSRSDAELCFRRHATSKVHDVDDLHRIRTLGFRGEALASIAAVARVEMKTRREGDPVGTLVQVEGSEQVAVRPCAAPAGTSLAVRNLFYNVPARRNFLKTQATELKHCVETFQQLALAHPQVAFVLSHNGNEMYRLPAQEGASPEEALRRRIASLFGDEHLQHLVRVDEAVSDLTVRGFVAEPEFTRKSRGEQFLFVNGRYVQSRYLSHAVKVAYGDLLMDGAFPFFALTLYLDPARVDVNVHPTKAEVKFDDEQGVYNALRTIVKRSLGRSDLTPLFDEDTGGDDRTAGGESDGGVGVPPLPSRGVRLGGGAKGGTQARYPDFRSKRSAAPQRSERARTDRPLGDLSEELYRLPDAMGGTSSEEATTTDAASRRGATSAPGEMWQLGDRYLALRTDAGLTFIDQQAAHQRILYEQALERLRREAGDSQQLLFPATIELNPAHFGLMEELLPQLRALGFDIEPFGGRSVVVRGVPADVRAGAEASMLEEVLEQYQEQRSELQLKGRENLARSIAVRGAVRPGERLSREEQQALLRSLYACDMPYASPSGRPTVIKMPIEELDRRFDRT